MNRGIADLQSAALPLGYDAILVCRLFASLQTLCSGAGNETRTRYLHLGKVALYRMSYARIGNVLNSTTIFLFVKHQISRSCSFCDFMQKNHQLFS